MTKTGIGQGTAIAPPFYAKICYDMYCLKEAADATAWEQQNEITNFDLYFTFIIIVPTI